MLEALADLASFRAGNGRLFSTIGPCLSVGSNWLLWLAGEPHINGRWIQLASQPLGAILHLEGAGERLALLRAEGEELVEGLGIVAPRVR